MTTHFYKFSLSNPFKTAVKLNGTHVSLFISRKCRDCTLQVLMLNSQNFTSGSENWGGNLTHVLFEIITLLMLPWRHSDTELNRQLPFPSDFYAFKDPDTGISLGRSEKLKSSTSILVSKHMYTKSDSTGIPPRETPLVLIAWAFASKGAKTHI